MLENLSTSVLEESHEKAIELGLDEAFIKVLEEALNERIASTVS